MALKLLNLDEKIRASMVAEFEEFDVTPGDVYLSPRLNDHGRKMWAPMLTEAARGGDDRWLAQQLTAGRMLIRRETAYRKGRHYVKDVPHNAAEILAEGEFNRIYIRGLCREVLASGGSSVVVYRARWSENPRPESECLVGRVLDAKLLLENLRASKGQEPALLPHVNTGLSVHLPTP